MSAITVQLPDELAERLRKHEERLPEILELGLRELNADPESGFEGLAGLPSPEDTLKLRPSERFGRQVQELLEKSRAGALTAQEENDWEHYEFLEHLVRMGEGNGVLKARY